MIRGKDGIASRGGAEADGIASRGGAEADSVAEGPEDSARTADLAASLPPDRLSFDLPDLRRATASDRPPPMPPPPPPPAAEPSVRRRAKSLGKYQFIATLGRGGMADVHLAVSVGPAGFSKLQVIKCLRPGIADEPEFRDMLLDEARLASRLNHRNVVQTNEVGLADDQYFLAMEYLDGQPLNRVISRAREREPAIPLAISLWILCEVLAGLHYAHELADYDGTPLGVVHRDISPHNVFVTYDGQVKIVDFGIALAARRVVETRTGTLKGKVAYMAPEQAFGTSSEVDRRADLYSVGVILWEILASRRMWRGLNDPQIISRLLRDIPDVRTVRPDVPFELARICGRALARDPADRYPTAVALRDELMRTIERMGEQITAADVSELVTGMFREEREEIRAIIDRQLKSLEGVRDDRDWESGRRSSLPPIAPNDPEEETRRSAPPPAVTPSSQPPQGTLQAVIRPEESRPRSLLSIVVLCAGLAALAMAVVLVLTGGPREIPAPAPAVTAPLPASAPPRLAPPTAALPPETAPALFPASAAPQEGFIRVRIAANPSDAKILIDGSELPSNPFESRFRKDDAAHKLEIRAAGFVPQRRMVVFDGDVDMDVLLQPLQRTGAPAPSDPPGVPPAKPDPY